MWNGREIGKFLGVGWAILVPWEVLWDRKTSIVGPAIPYHLLLKNEVHTSGDLTVT